MSERIEKDNVRKIVLVMPSIGMGEVVFISMVVGVLRANMPGASITFISGEYSCAFLRFIPGVKECLALESMGFCAGRSLKERGLLSKLRYLRLFPRFYLFFRRRAYDLAVISGRGRLFTSWLNLILRLSGSGQVVVLGKILQRHLNPRTHVLDSYRAILKEMGFVVDENIGPTLSVSDGAVAGAGEFLQRSGIVPGRHKVIGICPLSTRAIKNWAPGKFLELMERLGTDPDVRIVVFAHGGEDAVKPFRDGDAGRVVVGDVSLERLVALIRHCDLFISVDTGPMHIASALGVPTVGIFGPTSATMYGPYGKGNISLAADVSGCRYFDPTFMGSDKAQLCYSEDRCLVDKESCVNRVSVSEVLGAAAKLLPLGGLS